MNPPPMRGRRARPPPIVAARRILVALLSAAPAWGPQTISGRIDGHVTDSSGAVLPGRHGHRPQRRHGLHPDARHRRTGLFTATNLPVGTYSITAELQGFRRQQTGINLTADGRITSTSRSASANSPSRSKSRRSLGETVNRTSGEVARTIDSQQIKDLAFNGRNYLELASLIPGAVATDFDPLALATSLSITGQSINGSRGNTNNLTVDGSPISTPGSNGIADQQRQPELHRSGQDPDVELLGRGRPQQRRRRSTSSRAAAPTSFRGTARYDFRDEKFDSPNYFAPRDADGNRTKPPLEFRNFEGAFGGPVLKNKLFFFGGQQYRTINRFTNPTRQTLPTTAELNGDFSSASVAPTAIVGTADDGVLRDPVTKPAVPGQRHPAEPHHDRRPRAREHLPRDAGQARRVHGHADGQQHDVPGLQPVRVSGRTSSASTGRPTRSSASTAATSTTSTT